MGKYKKCPRCELNWIKSEEDLCEVCKAELGKASTISLLEDDDEEYELDERICPICKVNYLDEGEEICHSCRAEQEDKTAEKDDADDGWKEFVDEDEPIDDEEEEISLSQLQEEEELDDDETEEEDEFEEIGDIDDIELDDLDDEAEGEDDDI